MWFYGCSSFVFIYTWLKLCKYIVNDQRRGSCSHKSMYNVNLLHWISTFFRLLRPILPFPFHLFYSIRRQITAFGMLKYKRLIKRTQTPNKKYSATIQLIHGSTWKKNLDHNLFSVHLLKDSYEMVHRLHYTHKLLPLSANSPPFPHYSINKPNKNYSISAK